ncbi:MAG: nitroreductase family protein [Bacteroidota bacterium]
MLEKVADTVVPIHELIARRWSPRAYDISKIVSRDMILSLCEAGRWAPSCFGDEPWRMIVLDRQNDPSAWERGFNCLSDWNKKWVKNAQVLFIVCADSKFRNEKANRWGQYDTGAASENICIQAVALGLVAHQMAGWNKADLRSSFQIPEQFEIMAMIAVGYQAEPDILDSEMKKTELDSRKRRPLGSEFFEGKWGLPIL